MSLEKLKELGFAIVHEAEGLVRAERVTAAGTQRVEGASAEDLVAQLAAHPGALGTDVSRSDGAAETRDQQIAHSAEVGPNDLPTPAADAVAHAQAAAEIVAASSNEVIADVPGEVVTGRAEAPGEAPAEPESAPEGTVAS